MEDVFMLGKKLKYLREDRKYKQEVVATDLGIPLSTYSDYERGVLNVPSPVIVKASELYKVDLSYFYSLRGPVSITMNDHASNGYVEQQQNVPAEFMEKVMRDGEQRERHLMQFIEQQTAVIKAMAERQG